MKQRYDFPDGISREMLEWLCTNMGWQGSGWWRTGHTELTFKDRDAAVLFLVAFKK